MTIRVTIKNEDTRETAVIEVVEYSTERSWPDKIGQKLSGGQSCEVLVHDLQSVNIREISQ